MSVGQGYVTLLSNTPGARFVISRERLRVLPYFDALFDSPFADREAETFAIVDQPHLTYEVEAVLFETYLSAAGSSATWDASLLEWVANRPGTPRLRDAISILRLAAYYGMDLAQSIHHVAESLWTECATRTNFSAALLSSFLKTARALDREVGGTGDGGKLQKLIFTDAMKFNHPVLRVAHYMESSQQRIFWRDLIFALDRENQVEAGHERWPGFVIPYFRIHQSFPARDVQAVSLDHGEQAVTGREIAEEYLVRVLDERHFLQLKWYRESNGHQFGDFALHSAPIIRKFNHKQLLWCWLYWSNSDVEKREWEVEAGWTVLLRRLKQIWPSLALSDEIDFLDAEKKASLTREIGLEDW